MPDTLRVLIADFAAGRSTAVEQCLAGRAGFAVTRAATAECLPTAARSVDAVIACVRPPDRRALDALRRAFAAGPLPIVLSVDRDDPHFMAAAIAAGVSAYHVEGVGGRDIEPIVRSAIVLFRHHRRIAEELAAAHARLAENAIIDEAKAQLIRRHRLSEPEAYRLLRRRAMNEGRRIADIARAVVATGN